MSESPEVSPSVIAALAIQVTALRGSLGIHQRETGEALDVIRERLAAIAAQLAVSPPAGRGPAAAWFPGMSPADRDAAAEALRQWVAEVLRQWYPGYMRQVPECWLNHPEALIELSNLAGEFARVYTAASPPLDAALNLHERVFPGILKRISGVTANCAPGYCARITDGGIARMRGD